MSKSKTSETLQLLQQELVDLGSEIKISIITDSTSGEERGVLHAPLRAMDFHCFGDDLEKLSESAKSFFKTVQSAEYGTNFANEDEAKRRLQKLHNLCPNLDAVTLKQDLIQGAIAVPKRNFSALHDFQNLKSVTYPDGCYEGYGATEFAAISDSFRSLKELMPNACLDFRLKDGVESYKLSLSQSDLDKVDADLSIDGNLLSLSLKALFAGTNSIRLTGEFSGENVFQDNLEKLHKLSPNLEALHLQVFGDNYIAEVQDFSNLAKFTNLKRLTIPAPLVQDFAFLNELKITELTADIPSSEITQQLKLYQARSAEGITSLLRVYDDALQSLKKLDMRYCPISQEIFEKLCENVVCCKDLSLGAQEITDFSSLSEMQELENLKVVSLNTSKGFNLSNLKHLELVDPELKDFSAIAPRVRNLETLEIESSYKNECKHSFKWSEVFDGVAELQELKKIIIDRKTSSPITYIEGGVSRYSSGGAGEVKINDQVIGKFLSARNLESFRVDGFQLYIDGVAACRISVGDEVEKLVTQRREKQRLAPQIRENQPDSSISPQSSDHLKSHSSKDVSKHN